MRPLSSACQWPPSRRVFTWSFLCAHPWCLCECPNLLALQGHQPDWMRAHTKGLVLTKDILSEYVHIQRSWGSGLRHMNSGGRRFSLWQLPHPSPHLATSGSGCISQLRYYDPLLPSRVKVRPSSWGSLTSCAYVCHGHA